MSSLEPEDHRIRFERIKRLKQFLKLMPRRTNVHRYPFLKYFSEWAKRNDFFWSIKPDKVIPALYLGSIITILPVQGVQLPLSLIGAWAFRTNLAVTVGLQFLSNAFTLPIIYAADYYLGHFLLSGIIHSNDLPQTKSLEDMTEDIALQLEATDTQANLWTWMIDIVENSFDVLFEKGLYFFAYASFGGLVLGLVMGMLLHLLYRLFIHPKSIDV